MSPAQPPPFPTGPKRTWLGNPLCLESSPGSQQATPWQGKCLEPAPTSWLPAKAEPPCHPLGQPPGCQGGST